MDISTGRYWCEVGFDQIMETKSNYTKHIVIKPSYGETTTEKQRYIHTSDIQ